MSDAPDIRQVLEHYEVVARGRNVSCPFHQDRTPSCSINYRENLWKCWSCGRGGSSWDLIMQKEETDFRGAVELAASLGITDGDARGGGEQLSGSRYAGRRKVSPRKGNREGGGGYTPSWRRR